jgi:uncharacterized membrane protein
VPGVGYFIAAGVFAPAIGQTLGYVGMEKIGVARSAPILNTSPIFSSVFAVFILGEVWTRQNMLGTSLVIAGIIVLSSSKPAAGEWRKKDVIYPLLGAVAFGVSTTLRKSGLMTVPLPLLAAAVTVGTAFVVLLFIIQVRGGRQALKFHRQSDGWMFGAALVNTGAILSFFSALKHGKGVRVEPVVAASLLTILWAAIFLRQIERLSPDLSVRCDGGGTILVVTAR